MTESAPSRWRFVRQRPFALAAAGVVVIGVGIVLLVTGGPGLVRGSSSASAAARQFVAAINAGNETSAANAACPTFADQARSEARAGADAGISFTLGPVTPGADPAAATATLEQATKFPSGTQHTTITLQVQRKSGRWLVCGSS